MDSRYIMSLDFFASLAGALCSPLGSFKTNALGIRHVKCLYFGFYLAAYFGHDIYLCAKREKKVCFFGTTKKMEDLGVCFVGDWFIVPYFGSG